MKVWFSYLAIAGLILLGLFDLVNFGLSITTVSTFAIAILFIISLYNSLQNKKMQSKKIK
ncbi:hypothetical protein [Companilactobacillus halodurans]|uniref:Uncharacterized protein n=1 Tax=Companilactobacillus halodurans TaxID=2584183 RepID=A0A5P0ZUD0_9LACO|nr:hypothetical protein [Companilactobacillus halodurans]MQS75997.1 hypothetical protein [Companilactobacillus halodurans]MQS96432.1 hypothetical protein [Companilactobacillus halodurans]